MAIAMGYHLVIQGSNVNTTSMWSNMYIDCMHIKKNLNHFNFKINDMWQFLIWLIYNEFIYSYHNLLPITKGCGDFVKIISELINSSPIITKCGDFT